MLIAFKKKTLQQYNKIYIITYFKSIILYNNNNNFLLMKSSNTFKNVYSMHFFNRFFIYLLLISNDC